MAGFKQFEPGRGLSLLGAGGPPSITFGVVPPMGMLLISSGKGCCLFSLGDCLGIGVGGAAVVGCSSMGGVFCGRMGGGNRGACPNRMWYEVARAPLSSCGLWHRVAWQEERKLWWLLLSSPKSCSSRPCMYLPCSLWNITAWEIFQAPASLMALKQAALASWTKWPLIVLASLTATRKLVLSSRTESPVNRWLWLLQLIWPLGTHSGATLPLVPR